MRRSIVILALITIALGCGYAWYLPYGLTVNYPGSSGDPMPGDSLQTRIRLPPGFAITTYASGIGDARFLRFTPKGDLLVTSPRQGKVILLESSGVGATANARVLLADLNRPHGIDLHDGWLYIGEGDAIARVRFAAETRQVSGEAQRIATLPSGGNHWTRTVVVGPDGYLYVSIGSTCNVCVEKDPRRAAIVRYQLDGSGEEIYATGLRNSVGFAWRPGTNDLFATDNGRDLLGDDFPPCELNRIVQGGFYGWPYANGNRIPDPDHGKGEEARIAASIPPAHGFQAHTAPLGIAFYTGSMFPERYRGAAFVAEHGSWNRSTKSGYKVVALILGPEGDIREEDFATGFEIAEKVSGRPVDVAVGPDGAIYVSDDFTGSVYRIAYGEGGAHKVPVAAPTAAVSGEPLAGMDAKQRRDAEGRGRALFDDSGCAACHVQGRQSHGETYKPLEHLARKYTVDSLAAFLAAPQPPMPLYPFDDPQRRDLAVYLLESKD